MKELTDWRSDIDRLDRELVELLNRRAHCVLELAPLKRQANKDVLDTAREQEVHRNLRQANAGPLPQESISRVFDAVMAEMRTLQEETQEEADE